jgi:transcriptional regulator with XRE-family HTH domain
MVEEEKRATGWALNVAKRLKGMRRDQRLRQPHIADALDISVSEISRLERGLRGLRVSQLGPWAKSLGCKVEIIMWDDAGVSAACGGVDDESRLILTEVAESLPFLPPPAREALVHQMRLWRNSG